MELKDMIEMGVPVDLTTLQDTELKVLMDSWQDKAGILWPTETVYDGAFKEKRRREIQRATKKPLNLNFYG